MQASADEVVMNTNSNISRVVNISITVVEPIKLGGLDLSLATGNQVCYMNLSGGLSNCHIIASDAECGEITITGSPNAQFTLSHSVTGMPTGMTADSAISSIQGSASGASYGEAPTLTLSSDGEVKLKPKMKFEINTNTFTAENISLIYTITVTNP